MSAAPPQPISFVFSRVAVCFMKSRRRHAPFPLWRRSARRAAVNPGVSHGRRTRPDTRHPTPRKQSAFMQRLYPKRFTMLPDIHRIHRVNHAGGDSQLAGSSWGSQLGGAGDRTGNLAVTSQPSTIRSHRPPHSFTSARGSTNTALARCLNAPIHFSDAFPHISRDHRHFREITGALFVFMQ